MGILSGITDTLFGDGGKDQSRKQRDENAANRAFIQQGTQDARAQIDQLWPQAQADRLFGAQGAQNIMQGFVPQQLGAFQQGNQQAQGTMGATAEQQRNARLGTPVDYNFLQPQGQYQANFDFLNQPLQGARIEPDPNAAPTQAQQDQAIQDQATTTVADTYLQYLGREADPSGMAYFTNMVTDENGLVNPAGVQSMINEITNSSEGKMFSQSQGGQQGAPQGGQANPFEFLNGYRG